MHEPNKRKAYFTDVCFDQNLFYLFWISVVFSIYIYRWFHSNRKSTLLLELKKSSIVLFSLNVYNIIIPGGLALGLVPESPYFLSHRGQSSSKAIQWLMVDPNWINEVEEDISKFLNHRNIDFAPRNPIFNGCYKLVWTFFWLKHAQTCKKKFGCLLASMILRPCGFFY